MKTSFRSKFKIFLHIFLGLLLGSCIAMIYVLSTDRFRDYVQTKIEQQFRDDCGLQFRCKIDTIDWLSCRVQLSNIHISSPSMAGDGAGFQEWSVMAEKLVIKGS